MSPVRTPLALRATIAAGAAVLAAVSFVPAASAAKKKAKDPTFKVMTRNIYLGGNIFLPIGAPDRATFEARTQELWNQVRYTDFPARAKLLANEVKKTNPDLIGFQEVAKWRRSHTGVKDGSATPSTIVVYDFLKSLEKEFKAKKLHYRPAVIQQEADIEAPTQQYDVRLTMRDVIFVKTGKHATVKVRKTGHKNYKTSIGVPVQTGTVTSKRGYVYVDASVDKRKFRYINTHLESITDAPRVAQTKELVARGGPTRVKVPLILGGDLNSDPRNPTDAGMLAYRTIIGAGFKDAAVQSAKGRKPPNTCCLVSPLINDKPPYAGKERIDHILLKSKKLRGIKETIVGKDRKNRTAKGLWPSDHAGVVETIRLSK